MVEPTMAQLKRELEAAKKSLEDRERELAAKDKDIVALNAAKLALQEVHKAGDRVSAHLPLFWRDRPVLWFAQAESHFSSSGITQDSKKYHCVVSHLDSSTSAEVEDIILGPSADRTYANLKKALTDRLSDSEQKRIKKLLSEAEMGDQKPSQFLRNLRSLAGSSNAVNETLLKQLWLERLPRTATAILSSHTGLDLNALAAIADSIVECAPDTPLAIRAVRNREEPDVTRLVFNTLQELKQQIASLRMVTPRPNERPPRARSQDHFRDNRNSQSRVRENSRSRLVITEKNSRRGYLIDTGSDVCCFPRRSLPGRKLQETNHVLSAANDSNIKTYGLLPLALNFGLRRNFTWDFIVADVTIPILGSDFLAHYHLLPDCKLKRLVDGQTGVYAQAHTADVVQSTVKVVNCLSRVEALSLKTVDLSELAQAQREDESCGLPTSSSLRPEEVLIPGTDTRLLDLTKCTHVLLRVDKVRRSLEAPYTGPHRVTRWDESGKTVVLDLKGEPVTVSIDRVKPAYLLAEDAVEVRQPPQPEPETARPAARPASPAGPVLEPGRPPPETQPSHTSPPPQPVLRTRYGRRVRFPDRFIPG
ncbi:Centrosomal protein of 290 kDa [Frankliniella fusca]|uniref:Centrosomal protein of 290 kDa n=1 Tax=Frankliniella fusca TaxID=407009 RepID=A0AAE1HN91_9NEOP|nr:Centrosomal protein of 290 kDa [Frankliniella fusca]